jgi:hypothetical protein
MTLWAQTEHRPPVFRLWRPPQDDPRGRPKSVFAPPQLALGDIGGEQEVD